MLILSSWIGGTLCAALEGGDSGKHGRRRGPIEYGRQDIRSTCLGEYVSKRSRLRTGLVLQGAKPVGSA